MKNIETFTTLDGSVGLYNTELDEVYHSKFGAKKEAFEKFIEPAMIINDFLNDRHVDILDICYGIGYNTKCALENFNGIASIDCVEKDFELAKKSFEFEYDDKINKIIENNLKNPDFIRFYFEDIRKTVKKLNKKYDVIFHDGFKPTVQPELWSEELILEISKLLKPEGIYCTYNHSKPVLNALKQAGLFVGKTVKDDKIIGTVASKNKDLILNPLNNYELGELNTKSAITYKDSSLDLTSAEILKNREHEVESSKLMSLSAYKKIKSTTEAF